MKTKQIAHGIAIYTHTANELGDNGMTGDGRQVLCIARMIGDGNGDAVYIETNGNPIYLGARCGNTVYMDVKPDEMQDWARRILIDKYLTLDYER